MDQIILPKFFILVLLAYVCQSVKIILKNTKNKVIKIIRTVVLLIKTNEYEEFKFYYILHCFCNPV